MGNLGFLASRSIGPSEAATQKSLELQKASWQDDSNVKQPRSTLSNNNKRLADSVSAVTLVPKEELLKELREQPCQAQLASIAKLEASQIKI